MNNYSLNKQNVLDFLSEDYKQKDVVIESIGLIQSGIGDWDMSQVKSIETAAQSKNVDVIKKVIDPDMSLDIQQLHQIEAISQLIDEDVDAIVLSPVKSDGWDSAFDVAYEKEIPLIIINNPIESMQSDRQMFIGYDGHKEGNLMGRWLVDNLYGEEDIHLTIVGGQSDTLAQEERLKAITDITDEYSRISVSSRISENQWSSSSVIQAMSSDEDV